QCYGHGRLGPVRHVGHRPRRGGPGAVRDRPGFWLDHGSLRRCPAARGRHFGLRVAARRRRPARPHRPARDFEPPLPPVQRRPDSSGGIVQTQGGAAAEAAILSKERHFTSDVRVDWAGDGSFSGPLFNLSPFIRDIAVNRALEGQLPPEVNLTEGSAAAELTFTLKNARDPESGLRLIQCLSTLNSKSPLAGKDLVGAEITWDIWVDTPTGPVKYRQFIGNIRTIQPNRVDGTIQITALDRVEKLRHPVTLPPWAYSHQAASVDGRFEGQLQNPQGVIDAALRGNGADGHPTSPTPYSPTAYDWLRREDYFGAGVSSGGCHFWLTGTSSVPVLGYCDEPHRSTYYPTETTGIQMFDHLGAVHPDSPDPGIVPLSIKAKGGTNRSNIYYRVPDSAAVHEWGNHYLG